MVRHMRVALVAVAALFTIYGCGGGGNGGGQVPRTTSVQIPIHWAERGRALEPPASALSAVVVIRRARPDGSDLSATVDRDANAADHTRVYTTNATVVPGTWNLEATFHAGSSGTGDVVGTASASVTIQPDGSGIGAISTVGKVASVEVDAGQTVHVAEKRALAFTARNAAGETLAVSSGSAIVKVTAGGSILKVTDGLLEGVAPGTAKVTATVDGKVSPAVDVTVVSNLSLALNPDTVGGGGTSTGTVTLEVAAPAGGLEVALSSSDTAVATVPDSVTVPAGQRSRGFAVTARAVGATANATIKARLGGEEKTATLTVTPAKLGGLSLSPTSVASGGAITGTVTLTGPAPAGGVTVALESDNLVLPVPALVTVAEGDTSATFDATAKPVSALIQVTISAKLVGETKTAIVTVKPLLASVALNRSTIPSTGTATGTVTLNTAAPAGGTGVDLTSSDTRAAQVPNIVHVPQGQTSATFTLTAGDVGESTDVTVSAKLEGATVTAKVTVDPLLASINLNVNSVKGGASATGTVQLNGPAPAGGAVVNLTSSGATATVPASVAVPQGASTAAITVQTTTVAAEETVTITANRAGAIKSVELVVRP